MDDRLRSALDELAAITSSLGGLNPNDLGAVSESLNLRSQVTIRIHRLIADGHVHPAPEAVDRLTVELNQGTELIRRLEVARAKLRGDYEESSQTSGLLRSIRSPEQTPRRRLNLRG